ncbi:MAG: HTTM domain-containing protein [Myxococcales bacterium]|nr:HTTM domain-containing protein [Myxococcales bacterium]
MKRAFDRYFFGPVDSVRPYLLLHIVLAMVGLDCFVELVPHGWRYGVDGFNVAHFRVLDALGPTPTAGLYVTVVALAGGVALTMALTRPTRVGLATVAALYTYGWAMSMLDSYQHHYLLSLVLGCFVFFPLRGAREVLGEHALGLGDDSREFDRTAPAPGYVVVGVTFAIVYFYAAVGKLGAEWRDGSALQRIVPLGGAAQRNPDRTLPSVDDLLRWANHLGLGDAGAWRALALSAVALQLACCVAYLLVVHRDAWRRPWLRQAFSIAGLAPLAFHVGVSSLDLSIGWFTGYMIVAALVFFAPASALALAADWGTVPVRALYHLGAAILGRLDRASLSVRVLHTSVVVLAVGVGLAVWRAGRAADLPGIPSAAALAALALVVGVAWRSWRAARATVHTRRPAPAVVYASARPTPPAVRPAALGGAIALVLGAAIAASVASVALTKTRVRFDYYRWAGADARRRGDYEQALGFYEKANAYAPLGESRDRIERELRQRVEDGRAGG